MIFMFNCYSPESGLEFVTAFNRDISKWNVSKVTTMESMFSSTPFNGVISQWNVSSVTNMSDMFSYTPFNGDISGWDVSSVTNMGLMFSYTPFNGDISQCNVSSVTSMNMMFYHSPFNGDISGWDVSNVTNMSGELLRFLKLFLFRCKFQCVRRHCVDQYVQETRDLCETITTLIYVKSLSDNEIQYACHP